jgi:hypothetical protein
VSVTTAVIGGEVRHRRGMQRPAVRFSVMGVAVALGSIFGGQPGVLIGLVVAGLIYITTLSTGGERSIAYNIGARRRWKRMVRMGYDKFRPVADRPVNCVPGSREWNAHRDFTDGVDRWEFLGDDPLATAVCYHETPDGHRYFSATFRVDGPLVGLATDEELDRAQAEFANLLAGWGSREKLVSGMQVMTRMLPPDTVMHEGWVARQKDAATPDGQWQDYRKLLRGMSGGRYVQRHYATLTWDRSPRFTAVAKDYGVGDIGWRALVLEQIESARGRCVDAGYQRVRELTGPQHAALIRHLQNPDFHPDETADITSSGMYRPSDGDFRSVTTDGKWVHRTAVIPPDAVETNERDGRWMRPLLIGMERRMHRTVTICLRFIPSDIAKKEARDSATYDRADQITDQTKGRLENDDTAVSLTAAQRRIHDLRSGAGHHGVLWTGFVTITVPVAESLALAVGAVEEAADDAGIARLGWCDGYQPAAQSYTWPMGRGIPEADTPRTAKVLEALTMRSAR